MQKVTGVINSDQTLVFYKRYLTYDGRYILVQNEIKR